jgi:hypothetical protein
LPAIISPHSSPHFLLVGFCGFFLFVFGLKLGLFFQIAVCLGFWLYIIGFVWIVAIGWGSPQGTKNLE